MRKFTDSVSPLGTKRVCVSNSALESGMYLQASVHWALYPKTQCTQCQLRMVRSGSGGAFFRSWRGMKGTLSSQVSQTENPEAALIKNEDSCCHFFHLGYTVSPDLHLLNFFFYFFYIRFTLVTFIYCSFAFILLLYIKTGVRYSPYLRNEGRKCCTCWL